MRRSSSSFIVLASALLLLAGCGARTYQTFSTEQGGYETGYLTFEYPFTDAAAEQARTRAQRQCGQKKQVAIKTKSACSLNRCTTSFQCMSPAEAAKYPDDSAGK